jgi:hypothetical protein
MAQVGPPAPQPWSDAQICGQLPQLMVQEPAENTPREVTDQNLEPQSRAKRAWLCEPKVNRAT